MHIACHMAAQKVRLITVLLLLATVVGLPERAPTADIRHWQSFTSFNQVTDMILYNGDIWAATTGGLVRINPAAMTHKTYTNVDGMGMNRLLCLCVDSRNRLWVGGRGRLVDFSDPSHPDGYLFTDRDGQAVDIYDMECTPEGDSLWLANRLGVTLFLISDTPGEGLILDTYTRFGDIGRDTPANRVALSSDSIWVGTPGGLAVGARADVRLLKAPSGWVSYFPSQFSTLPGDTIRTLVVKSDSIFVGTSAGAYRFDRIPGLAMTSLNLYGDPIIYNMSHSGDSILINSAVGSVFYHDGTLFGVPTAGMPIANTAAGVRDGSGQYWDGNLYYGIYRQEGPTMIHYDVGGTPVNECRQITAAQGKIWGGFAGDILAYYQNGKWTTVPGITGLAVTMAVGPLGELWVGTIGHGVYRILGDSIAHYTADNSGLSGLWNAPAFVVITGAHSSGDAVWFTNFLGNEGELVAVNPYNTAQWQPYVLIGGENAELTITVTVGQDVVYVGSEGNGIYAIAHGGTPFYTADDFRWEFTAANSLIGSDFIKDLEIDGYDTLWVATGFGLSYQALGEVFFRNVTLPVDFGPEVTVLAFDGKGSVYAGSNTGIAVRDIATGDIELLTSTNSGLVDNTVYDIFHDDESGALWIATGGGISRMTMPYSSAARDLDEVLAYPNPYIIKYGHETVRFNYSGLAEVRIFTLAGELVREIPINGEWDGRNADGEAVASGIYLFALTNRDNEVGRGKLILIRE